MHQENHIGYRVAAGVIIGQPRNYKEVALMEFPVVFACYSLRKAAIAAYSVSHSF